MRVVAASADTTRARMIEQEPALTGGDAEFLVSMLAEEQDQCGLALGNPAFASLKTWALCWLNVRLQTIMHSISLPLV